MPGITALAPRVEPDGAARLSEALFRAFALGVEMAARGPRIRGLAPSPGVLRRELLPMDEAFWTQLAARIVTALPAPRGPATADVIPFAAAAEAAPGTEEPAADAPHPAADWGRILDVISDAKTAAFERDARLREHGAAYRTIAADLAQARDEILRLEAALQNAHARTEAVVREAKAQAQAVIRKAEANARAADLRAETAEGWLGRIEQASRELLADDRGTAA